MAANRGGRPSAEAICASTLGVESSQQVVLLFRFIQRNLPDNVAAHHEVAFYCVYSTSSFNHLMQASVVYVGRGKISLDGLRDMSMFSHGELIEGCGIEMAYFGVC
jgi:hypothetical protein